jgi:hypothetical protein
MAAISADIACDATVGLSPSVTKRQSTRQARPNYLANRNVNYLARFIFICTA